jgi:glucokinase
MGIMATTLLGPHTSSESTVAVGIDVGGTKIAGGVVCFPEAVVRDRDLVPTRPERGPESVWNDVATLAEELARRASAVQRPFAGVGIGVPELVDLEGRVTSGQTIDWRGLSLSERLARLGSVRVEADVRAAALAEAHFGAGLRFRLFVYISVGTGISSTLVQDGRPFAGARGNALIFASGTLRAVCPHCGATVDTVLEDLASGPALERRYRQVAPAARAGAEGVLAAAAGDPEAVAIVRAAAGALGNGIAWLVNVLDPEAVVIGGGLGMAGGLYWNLLIDSTRRHIWAENSRMLPIIPAVLGTDAGIIGAAYRVVSR